MSRANPYLDLSDVLARYKVSEWTLSRWRRDEQKGFPKPFYISRKPYFRLDELEAWERAQQPGIEDKPPEALGMPIVSEVIQTYEDFVKAMRDRRDSLKLPAIEADALGGHEEGYTNKLENYGKGYGRGMGPDSFPRWLKGMRVGIVLVALPRRPHVKRKDRQIDMQPSA